MSKVQLPLAETACDQAQAACPVVMEEITTAGCTAT